MIIGASLINSVGRKVVHISGMQHF